MSLTSDQLAAGARRRVWLMATLLLALVPSTFLLWILLSGAVLPDWLWPALLGGWVPYYAVVYGAWKCPNCGARLGSNPQARMCRSCGINLESPT